MSTLFQAEMFSIPTSFKRTTRFWHDFLKQNNQNGENEV